MYFSEVDALMDETGCYAPLIYLCERHGFAIPERIDPFTEMDRLERELKTVEEDFHAKHNRLRSLQKLTHGISRPTMLGGHAYLKG
jgi:hypothetical protein